jgi:hypothetical protein
MTSNELLMLATGFALGAHLMAVLHLFWDRQDARRADARARAAFKRSAGDRYLSSLRLYQLQHRSQV